MSNLRMVTVAYVVDNIHFALSFIAINHLANQLLFFPLNPPFCRFSFAHYHEIPKLFSQAKQASQFF